MKRSLALIAACLALVGNAHAVDGYLFGDSRLDWAPGNKLTGTRIDNSTFELSIIDSGSYDSTGFYESGETNYIVGPCTSCGLGSLEYHNWFVADLTSFTGTIKTLSLTLHSFAAETSGNFTLYDYKGSIAALQLGGDGLTGIYADLGTGPDGTYGSRFYQSSDSASYRSITLNQNAIDDLNAAVGQQNEWALGGAFDATAPIPEPETYALMLAGLGVVGWMAWRRKA